MAQSNLQGLAGGAGSFNLSTNAANGALSTSGNITAGTVTLTVAAGKSLTVSGGTTISANTINLNDDSITVPGR